MPACVQVFESVLHAVNEIFGCLHAVERSKGRFQFAFVIAKVVHFAAF
jgi:hypothetical protein